MTCCCDADDEVHAVWVGHEFVFCGFGLLGGLSSNYHWGVEFCR